ncbi:molecular chaperone Hsp20 [Halobacteriales archaeon QS_1_68_44]|nr:MAG: molecular chaperone Hsp20 [Halobacteriales archaeon QS_1_68_44]
MIREVGESVGRVVLNGIGRASSRVQERRPLPADLLESDDAYLAVFDAPGARAGDVDVRFESDTLTVRIDRFRDLHEDYEMRFPGRGLSLTGSVTFPESADVEADAADATLTQNGTLEVLIPKRDPDEEADAAERTTDDGTEVDDEAEETADEEHETVGEGHEAPSEEGETNDREHKTADEEAGAEGGEDGTDDNATDETTAGTDETMGENGEATGDDSGDPDGDDENGEATDGDG